jgi:hypothetical protein
MAVLALIGAALREHDLWLVGRGEIDITEHGVPRPPCTAMPTA